MSLADLGSLRVSVSLDSARFDQGVKAMNARMSALRSEYKAMNDGTKGWDKSITGLAAKQRMLTGLLDAQASKVRSLRTAYNEATVAHGRNSAQADRAAARLNNQIAQHTKLRNELSSVNRAYALATNATYQWGVSMAQAGSQLSTFGDKAMGAGLSSLMITAPLVYAGKNVIGFAMDFEYSMAKVKAVANLTGAEYETLSARARELGSSTIFSASEAASGMLFLSMAGQKFGEVYQNIPKVLTLAQAGFMDLGLAADIATNVMTPFKLQASETGRVVDVLAAAASNANTDIPMLGEAMKYLAPAAANAGWSVEDAAAALMIFANNGLRGSVAGQAFASSLGRLASPSNEATKWMDKMGISFYDAEGNMKGLNELIPHVQKGLNSLATQKERTAAITDIFGVEAQKHWMALLSDNEGQLQNFTELLKNSNGEAQRMADTMGETFYGKVKSLQSAFEELKIAIGSELIDGLSSFVIWLTKATSAMAEHAPMLGKMLGVAIGLSTAFSVLSLATGGLGKAIGSVNRLIGEGAKKSAELTVAKKEQLAASKKLADAAKLESTRLQVANRAMKEQARDMKNLSILRRDFNNTKFGISGVEAYKNIRTETGLGASVLTAIQKADSQAALKELDNFIKKRNDAMLRATAQIGGFMDTRRPHLGEFSPGLDKDLDSLMKQVGKLEQRYGSLDHTMAGGRVQGEQFSNMIANANKAFTANGQSTIAATQNYRTYAMSVAKATKIQQRHVDVVKRGQKVMSAPGTTIPAPSFGGVKVPPELRTFGNVVSEQASKASSSISVLASNFVRGLGPMAMMAAQAAVVGAALTGLGIIATAVGKKIYQAYTAQERAYSEYQTRQQETITKAAEELKATESVYESKKRHVELIDQHTSAMAKLGMSNADLAQYIELEQELANTSDEGARSKISAEIDQLVQKYGGEKGAIDAVVASNAELLGLDPAVASSYGEKSTKVADYTENVKELIRAEMELAKVQAENAMDGMAQTIQNYFAEYENNIDNLTQKEQAASTARIALMENEGQIRVQSMKIDYLTEQEQNLVNKLKEQKAEYDGIADKSSERAQSLREGMAETEATLDATTQTRQELELSNTALSQKTESLRQSKQEAEEELRIAKEAKLATDEQIAGLEAALVKKAQALAAEQGIQAAREQGLAPFEAQIALYDEEIAALEKIQNLTPEQAQRLLDLKGDKEELQNLVDEVDMFDARLGTDGLRANFKIEGREDIDKLDEELSKDRKAIIEAEADTVKAQTELEKMTNKELKPGVKPELDESGWKTTRQMIEDQDIDIKANLETGTLEERLNETTMKDYFMKFLGLFKMEEASAAGIEEAGADAQKNIYAQANGFEGVQEAAERSANKNITGVDANGSVQSIDSKANQGATKAVQGVDAGGSVQRIDSKANEGATKSVQSLDGKGSLSRLISLANQGERKAINFHEGSRTINSVLSLVPKSISVAMNFVKGLMPSNKYRGTLSHPGGLSYVGEMGRELGFIPGEGWQMLGQGGQELRYLPRGSKVIPNGLTEQIMRGQRKIPGYATGVGLEGVINVEVPREGRENVYNINLNYTGSASKEDAMTMAQIVMDEIEKKERRNRRARGEK